MVYNLFADDMTNHLIGVNETLLGTFICGVIFALLSGQPLMFIAATGPTVVFEGAVFDVRIIF